MNKKKGFEQLELDVPDENEIKAREFEEEVYAISDEECAQIEGLLLRRPLTPRIHLSPSQLGILLSEIRIVDSQVIENLTEHVATCHDCLIRVLELQKMHQKQKRRKAQIDLTLTD